MQVHYAIPEQITGYELRPDKGNFSIIKPERTTNLVENPSFEVSFYGWDKGDPDVFLMRSNYRSARGAFSALIMSRPTLAANMQYIQHDLSGWANNLPLTLSVDVWATHLDCYVCLVVDGVEQATVSPSTIHEWQRLTVTTPIATPATVAVRLAHNSIVAGEQSYFDGVQVEQKGYATTYVDGDMEGLRGEINANTWQGERHKSASIRSATTKTGGRKINLLAYGFRVTGYQGALFTPFNTISQEYALTEGAYYQRTIAASRDLTLIGVICGKDYEDIACKQFDLQRLLAPNVATQNAEFVLEFEDCECEGALRLTCVYMGGFEGDYQNHYQQRYSLSLRAHDPFWLVDGQRAGKLQTSGTLIGINEVITRSSDGQWQALPAFSADSIVSLKVKWLSETVFASIETDTGIIDGHIGKYVNGTWQTVDTDLNPFRDFDIYNEALFAIAESGLNTVVEVNGSTIGSFPTADRYYDRIDVGARGLPVIGGKNNALLGNILRYNGSNWTTILSDVDGEVRQIKHDKNGNIYVVGYYTTQLSFSTAQITKDYSLKCLPTVEGSPETDEFSMIMIELKRGGGPGFAITYYVAPKTIPDGVTVVSWDWSTSWDAATYTGQKNNIIWQNLDQQYEIEELYIDATLSNGLVCRYTFHFMGRNEDAEWEQKTELDTNEPCKIGSLSVAVSANCCIDAETGDPCNENSETTLGYDEDDPVTSYLWTNSVNGDTITEAAGTFDFGVLAAQDITFTLTTTTVSGASVTNSVVYAWDETDFVFKSSTDNTTYYQLLVSNPIYREYQNALYLSDGVWQDFGQLLPPVDSIAIDEINNFVYLGLSTGLARWDGTTLNKLSSTTGAIKALAMRDGLLAVAAENGLFVFDGTTFTEMGLNVPASWDLKSVAISNNGQIAVGGDFRGQRFTSTAGWSTVVYAGTVESRPQIRIDNEGILKEIFNNTTRKRLIFDYRIEQGEQLTVDLRPGRVSAVSNLGNETELLPASIEAWHLALGENYITVTMVGQSAVTKATVISQPAHHTADALCCDDFADDQIEVVDGIDDCCVTKIVGDSPSCYSEDDAPVGTRWFDVTTGQLYIRVE